MNYLFKDRFLPKKSKLIQRESLCAKHDKTSYIGQSSRVSQSSLIKMTLLFQSSHNLQSFLVYDCEFILCISRARICFNMLS